MSEITAQPQSTDGRDTNDDNGSLKCIFRSQSSDELCFWTQEPSRTEQYGTPTGPIGGSPSINMYQEMVEHDAEAAIHLFGYDY